MDPLFITGLGIGIGTAIEKLVEKGFIDPALEHGLEPLTRKYDEKRDAEDLRKTLLAALDELNKKFQSGSWERLSATLKLTGLNQEQHTALAAAAIEMARYDPEGISPGLLNCLDIGPEHREMLAQFLFTLRKHLGSSTKYFPAIQHADNLDSRGLLRGLTQQIIELTHETQAIKSLLQTIIQSRRLSQEDSQVLAEYLNWAKQGWESLMLPLVRKRDREPVHTALKRIFVPLKLRDISAEEKARQKMTARKEQVKEEAIPLLDPGNLLNKYSRFILTGSPGSGKTTLLRRIALAFAEGCAAEDLGWKGSPLLPVFFRLRNFGVFLSHHKAEYPGPCHGSLVQFFENQYREGERKSLNPSFFDKRLDEGNCLVLLDGLDEVSENRGDVAQHICEFIRYYGKKEGNCFGISSRPKGFETVQWQLAPANLTATEVLPLQEDGIRQLIGNLFDLIEPDARQRKRSTQDLSEAILASEDLTEIASIPLFCSALVQVYKYHSAHLPERKVDVLEEIVDLLLGFWKASQPVADAEGLVTGDIPGRRRHLDEAVNLKRQRLSFLAFQMQENHLTAVETPQAVNWLAGYLQARERVRGEEIACLEAEDFLSFSHEHSGLLVEQEPGRYAFLHKAFMEYLAATWMVNRNEVISMTRDHLEQVGDDWWEPVLLLAGAHPKLPDQTRSDLINGLLEQSEIGDSPETRFNSLYLAGRLAVDMDEHLAGPEQEAIEECLLQGMQDPISPALQRSRLGDILGELGDPRPEVTSLEGMQFCYIPAGSFLTGDGKGNPSNWPAFWLGLFPVTNAQYTLFIESGGYAQAHCWDEARVAGWWKDGLFKGRYDNEPRSRPQKYRKPFDLPNHPVVGVSWYEALAFTYWLDEIAHRAGWLPKSWELTLPSSDAWEKAARGGMQIPQPGGEKISALKEIRAGELQVQCVPNLLPGRVYPWGDVFDLQKANTEETKIQSTNAVGCFLQGSSPYGVLEMSGNVWEWQMDWVDEKDKNYKILRGGSWHANQWSAHCADRGGNNPDFRNNYDGFRCALSLRS